MHISRSRSGLTLIELLVVIGIIGVLIALLLGAVMRVRESASIVESKNNLRQIVLGMHHFGAANQGRLPKLGYERQRIVGGSIYTGKANPPIFVTLLPYVEGQTAAKKKKGKFQTVPLFLSPADPGAAEAIAKNAAVSSYAANAEVFTDNPNLLTTFADGTSNTIAFAEHYAYNCAGVSFPYWENSVSVIHRPAFADFIDVRPVTQGDPPVSMPTPMRWLTSLMFQVAPRPSQCESVLPQTPHASGMIVALADGSVRQLAPSIGISIFWGAVTPNKGEILGGDWQN
jgi:prepilin-type N-terminal cleavage/methylation domain-containing protein